MRLSSCVLVFFIASFALSDRKPARKLELDGYMLTINRNSIFGIILANMPPGPNVETRGRIAGDTGR